MPRHCRVERIFPPRSRASRKSIDRLGGQEKTRRKVTDPHEPPQRKRSCPGGQEIVLFTPQVAGGNWSTARFRQVSHNCLGNWDLGHRSHEKVSAWHGCCGPDRGTGGRRCAIADSWRRPRLSNSEESVGMFLLSRAEGEQIVVPECRLTVTVFDVRGKRVQLGVSVPAGVGVYRGEVLQPVPLSTAQQEAAASATAAAAAEEVSMPARVLIADPDEYLTDQYRNYFEKRGIAVATAATGLECVERLRAFAPDVLVIEPSIPWGFGDGVLTMMHEEPDIPLFPVIVLTYGRDRGVLYRMAPFRIDDYQIKPLSANDWRSACIPFWPPVATGMQRRSLLPAEWRVWHDGEATATTVDGGNRRWRCATARTARRRSARRARWRARGHEPRRAAGARHVVFRRPADAAIDAAVHRERRKRVGHGARRRVFRPRGVDSLLSLVRPAVGTRYDRLRRAFNLGGLPALCDFDASFGCRGMAGGQRAWETTS